MVRIVKAEAQAQGITHCPGCRVELDYSDGTQPNGAQADEIVPWAKTGVTSTDPRDWQVLCRTCNRTKSDKTAVTLPAIRYPLSREW
jgi:hypothetical protein